MMFKQFIKDNRKEIDGCIVRAYGDNCIPSNDKERKEWVMNDEGLYNWARSEGVRI